MVLRWPGKRPLMLVSLLAVGSFAVAQQDFDSVEIETVEVATGIYMLVGAGGNIGVSVGDDGVVLIDDQYAPLTAKIQAAVAKLSERPIRFVINTHWHGDHTGGNENLGNAGAVILAHENVRKRMSSEQFSEFFDRRTPPSPEAALPAITFTRDASLHLNGDELHAFHLEPGHTDTDSIIHWREANVFHMGDLYFAGSYPYIDLSSGGSVDGVIAAADRVVELADDRTEIIPGHGPLSNKRELTAYRDMLHTIRSGVQSQVQAGKTLEAVKASGVTKAFDDAWGTGFINGEQVTEFVYRSLVR